MSDISHVMEVEEPWWTLIRSGLKTVEGRENSPKWSSVKVGDTIKIVNKGKFYYVNVSNINEYPPSPGHKNPFHPLFDYLLTEGLYNALPGFVTIDEGLKVYLKWSKWDEIEKYGFRGFHIEVLQ